LVGNLNTSTIRNSSATGAVTSNAISSATGGLVGIGSSFTISSSFATGNVQANNALVTNAFGGGIGGLVGQMRGTSMTQTIIQDSYAMGNVQALGSATGTPGYVGGLVGYIQAPNVTIRRTFAGGAVSANAGVAVEGGLIGQANAGANTFTDSFWDSDKNSSMAGVGSGTQVVGTAKTTAQLQQRSTYQGTTWNIGSDPALQPGQAAYPKLSMGGSSVWLVAPGPALTYTLGTLADVIYQGADYRNADSKKGERKNYLQRRQELLERREMLKKEVGKDRGHQRAPGK
jgi:hypothetical protein